MLPLKIVKNHTALYSLMFVHFPIAWLKTLPKSIMALIQDLSRKVLIPNDKLCFLAFCYLASNKAAL